VRTLLFRVVLIVLGIAAVELTAWLLLGSRPALEGRLELVSIGKIAGERARAQERIGRPLPGGGLLEEEAIHPFVGYATVPSAQALAGPLSLDSLGFPVGGPLVRERRPDTVVMGVFGGSVATYFAQGIGPERVFEGLQSLPRFAGRRLVVVGGAHAAYKQPQSLLALAYLQALGLELDLVILLDGFNEVVGAPFELLPAGVFPFYPWKWKQRIASLETDTAMRARIGEIAFLSEERMRWARRLLHSPLRRSRTAELCWALFDAFLESRVEAARLALHTERSSGAAEYAATGPPWPVGSGPALYSELAALWMESSLEMRALAESDGALFFHFLQPNQHVPDSKPMGAEERARALRGGEAFAPFAAAGYPILRERGDALRARGVRFHDLSAVYADTQEPVYVDNIGHVGRRGNEILADAIAAAIRTDLAAEEPVRKTAAR
jgi:hypothetical protein